MTLRRTWLPLRIYSRSPKSRTSAPARTETEIPGFKTKMAHHVLHKIPNSIKSFLTLTPTYEVINSSRFSICPNWYALTWTSSLHLLIHHNIFHQSYTNFQDSWHFVIHARCALLIQVRLPVRFPPRLVLVLLRIGVVLSRCVVRIRWCRRGLSLCFFVIVVILVPAPLWWSSSVFLYVPNLYLRSPFASSHAIASPRRPRCYGLL